MRLQAFIETEYHQPDKHRVLALCRAVIANDPARHCTVKGRARDWHGLPANKSLFHSPADCGLPIGNLSSQVFANFYLNALDHYVKHDLGIRYYGRYVDDFVLVHPDRAFLQSLIPKLGAFLKAHLQLTLHPKKIYLQHYSKGVRFLGTVIKPNRIYIGKRTQGNFYAAIRQENAVAEAQKPDKTQRDAFLSRMNSYLGLLKHYQTYRLRQKMLQKHLSPYWLRLVRPDTNVYKFLKKNRCRRKPPRTARPC